MEEHIKNNPLGSAPIPSLMAKFAVPSIVAMIITALYNIVDQLFIGNYVGTLGNAATNVAMPLTSCCIALALLCGIGGAANFNLNMGRGKQKEAVHYVGNSVTMMIVAGVALMIITRLFLKPMLIAFGSPADVLPYAETYVGVTSFGFPFLILVSGGCHLVRADGSPAMSMILNVVGAVINTVLDALFVIVFGWGMAGAAWATVIGQVVSGILVLNYFRKFKTVELPLKEFKPILKCVLETMKLGTAPCLNQLAIIIVQIVVNNGLRHYGALSAYGESIPLACCGIVMKVNMIFFSVIIGLSQSTQPIFSFNYGAKQYDRVKRTYFIANAIGLILGICAFIIFQTCPRQILMLFGDNTEEYFDFGVKFFRIFLFFTWANGIQSITSTLFTAIGKPLKGSLVSLIRQVLLFVPLALILPLFMGLFGILYTAPIADGLTAVISIVMVVFEFKLMKKLAEEKQ